MTNPTGEINGFSEQTAWAAESLTGLATLSVHSFEHLVRHSYGVAGDAIEYAIAALQTGTTSREVTAYLAAQTTLTQAYLARQSQRQTQLTALADTLRAGYSTWLQEAAIAKNAPPTGTRVA